MEDLRKTLRKNTSTKQNKNDPLQLFSQCQQQLDKLNKQLGCYLSDHRNIKINNVLPSLETLSSEISELKENLSYQITPQEKNQQRQELAKKKQILLSRLKSHSCLIEEVRKKIRVMNINNDELIREYEENKVLIENHYNRESMEQKMKESEVIDTQRESLYSEGRQLIKNKSVPSIFSPHRNTSKQSLHLEADSKWSKIDKIMNKMSHLNSDSLANQLLRYARNQKGGIKSLMKNYHVSNKIKDFVKKSDVRDQWVKLEAIYTKK